MKIAIGLGLFCVIISTLLWGSAAKKGPLVTDKVGACFVQRSWYSGGVEGWDGKN